MADDSEDLAAYGSQEAGGYNVPTMAYKNDPSIENYVKLRREDPAAEIEIRVVGGIEQLLFLETELKKHGFDPATVASALDADPDAISELSLKIMEKTIEARRLKESGKTHLVRRGLVVPDKLITWLIALMLDALSWNDELHIPRDLIVLVRDRLGGSKLEIEQASWAHEQRAMAINLGGQLLARGITPSFRKLADALGVAPSTVKRWFPNGEFMHEVQRRSAWYDPNGELRAAKEVLGLPLRRK